MSSVYSRAGFGQQRELSSSLGDDLSRGLIQPVEAGVEAGVAAGGISRECEMAVESCVDALGLSVQSKEQQLGRGLGEMEQREHVEAHASLIDRVDGAEERGLTN